MKQSHNDNKGSNKQVVTLVRLLEKATMQWYKSIAINPKHMAVTRLTITEGVGGAIRDCDQLIAPQKLPQIDPHARSKTKCNGRENTRKQHQLA